MLLFLNHFICLTEDSQNQLIRKAGTRAKVICNILQNTKGQYSSKYGYSKKGT